MPFFDPIRIGASGAADTAFTVDRSLRFNPADITNLERTFGSASNRRTWTFSFWTKRCGLGRTTDIFSPYRGGEGTQESRLYFQDTDKLRIYDSGGLSGYPIVSTAAVFRDTNAWYHFVVAVDTTQSTASNRVKMYANGVLQELDDTTYGNQNQQLGWNNNHIHRVGAYGYTAQGSLSSSNINDGYLAEINFIDGQQLTPSSFGETNSDTGQWVPIDTSGLTFGTNGFYLKFADNSGTTATTLGKDSSGNGNNFTPNNFSVAAGEGNDSVTDTPTNNFCTLNPLDRAAAITTQNGNLQIANASTGNYNGIRASFGSKTGKYYWEIKFPNTGYITGIGIARADGQIDNGNQPIYRIVLGLGSWFASYNSDNVNSYVNANPTSDYGNWSGASNYSANDIYMIAVDFDAGKIWWGKNGSWFNNSGTANPSTGTDPRHTFTVGNQWFPYSQEGDSSSCNQSYNFGQQGFAYTPPSGFVELSSANLPDPTILLPNKHFATFTYTGTGSSGDVVNITNSDVDFTPDWVWVKTRSVTNDHILSDSVRGGTKYLVSSENYAEQTDTDKIRAFIQNGFESGTDGDTNWPSRPFVAWNWNAGETDGKTYTVTVVDDSGNKYRFDGYGTSAVTLDLAEGGTYIFNYPSAHPLKFSTTSDGTHGGGSEYTTGVTHNSSTQVTIVVPASAPTLYYYCSIHSGMGGQVNTNSTLGSSNFDGTIQSVVKANATAGFSISIYSGNGTSGATIGHALGVKPDAIIIKCRSVADNWIVYHQGLNSGVDPEDYYIFLNSTNAQADSPIMLNDTAPTSSVITFQNDSTNNLSSRTYVMYCFGEVAGYSKFGKYVGNGSSDGTFVFTGFRVAWLLIRRIGGVENWRLFDNKRNTFNDVDLNIMPNSSAAEFESSAYNAVDFLSNGFKLRGTNADVGTNSNGETYIYLAFAESPFKNARAR